MTYEFKKSLSIRLYSFRIWLSFLMKLSTANRSISRCFSDKLFGIRKFITLSNNFGTDSLILKVGAFGAFHLIGFLKDIKLKSYDDTFERYCIYKGIKIYLKNFINIHWNVNYH